MKAVGWLAGTDSGKKIILMRSTAHTTLFLLKRECARLVWTGESSRLSPTSPSYNQLHYVQKHFPGLG